MLQSPLKLCLKKMFKEHDLNPNILGALLKFVLFLQKILFYKNVHVTLLLNKHFGLTLL